MKYFLKKTISLICAAFSLIVSANISKSQDGKIIYHEAFASEYVAPRTISVWLPEGYETIKKPLAVIYMHDGQNLFEPSKSISHADWNAGKTLNRLIVAKKVRPAIIVGIDNSANRGAEYMPQKVFKYLPKTLQANGIKRWGKEPFSDRYLSFIVKELKPFIDKTYATSPVREDTFIMGSSMGGLISLYAQAEYPNIFGASASLSMHWPLATPTQDLEGQSIAVIHAFEAYFKKTNLDPKTTRIYTDHGSLGLDGTYRPFSLKFESLMNRLEFTSSQNFSSQIFPNTDHNEKAWAKRLEIPLAFLLEKKTVAKGSLNIERDYTSHHAGNHDIRIWLPKGYDPNSDLRYKTLYMTDGQNLFDPSPYSGSSWGVAETLSALIDKKIVPPTIVIGIESRANRTREYMPQKVLLKTPEVYQKRSHNFSNGTPQADIFLDFIVNELKPMIDKTYNTKPDARSTTIMGSSMGGHFALYAQGEYPHIFGASASLSMPWIMAEPEKDNKVIAIVQKAWREWLGATRLDPQKNRIYIDLSSDALDQSFAPFQNAIIPDFKAYGFVRDDQLIHQIFKDSVHNEVSWKQRLDQPLDFLLADTPKP